ncbi:hypothetical protein [Jannaschia rubra]|uniref:hypothetical protein n=1 Tax=Jannaschia rubra TaxID=282197 RepID=UPI002493AC4B|nr:hypothetical protein [Jannaschia rubra]
MWLLQKDAWGGAPEWNPSLVNIGRDAAVFKLSIQGVFVTLIDIRYGAGVLPQWSGHCSS